MSETIVIALGGNAILKPKQRGTAQEQFHNVKLTCAQIARLIAGGNKVVITHGNGPQVGNILLQNEENAELVPAMPLDVCGAQSQGFIGYMIQQSLHNELQKLGLHKEVVTVVTQVLVDAGDPAFKNPTKPIGPFFSAEKAKKMASEKAYCVKEDAGRGWRRVVPSPRPKQIVERNTIRSLLASEKIVIASGGGGIPVVEDAAQALRGVEAVIDKDLAANRLAQDIKADTLLILTDVEQVCLNYRQPNEKRLGRITAAEARKYHEEGHFSEGSMGPKVEAAFEFVESGGGRSIITSLDKAVAALDGETGTWITIG